MSSRHYIRLDDRIAEVERLYSMKQLAAFTQALSCLKICMRTGHLFRESSFVKPILQCVVHWLSIISSLPVTKIQRNGPAQSSRKTAVTKWRTDYLLEHTLPRVAVVRHCDSTSAANALWPRSWVCPSCPQRLIYFILS